MRDAIMMSAADGTVDEEEFEVLLKIATGLGMEESVVDDLLDWVMDGYDWMDRGIKTVSYTHLTLPTICSV